MHFAVASVGRPGGRGTDLLYLKGSSKCGGEGPDRHELLAVLELRRNKMGQGGQLAQEADAFMLLKLKAVLNYPLLHWR